MQRTFLFAAASLSLLAVTGCGSDDTGTADTTVAAAAGSFEVVSPQRAAELAADASITVIDVYCRSGNRSAQAVAVMRDLGFTEVYDMEGGVIAWSEAGLPLQT